MTIVVHFDEAVIHVMQYSLVISGCNINCKIVKFLVFRFLQGSEAT